MVIAIGIFVLAGGIIVTITGRPTPGMALGAAVATVASGLFYTMDIHTSTAKWIGYQILAGAAIAFPYQNCLNIVHAKVDAEDISTVTAIVYCKIFLLLPHPVISKANISAVFQTLGGAFSISAAQSAFVNRLIATLPSTAPGVDPLAVYATGSTELRTIFPAEEIPGIILAYMQGIKAAFAVSIAMFGTAFVLSLILPWKKIHSNGKEDIVAMA
jgi:hypothetical protein